jgi:hypothetical protein
MRYIIIKYELGKKGQVGSGSRPAEIPPVWQFERYLNDCLPDQGLALRCVHRTDQMALVSMQETKKKTTSLEFSLREAMEAVSRSSREMKEGYQLVGVYPTEDLCDTAFKREMS